MGRRLGCQSHSRHHRGTVALQAAWGFALTGRIISMSRRSCCDLLHTRVRGRSPHAPQAQPTAPSATVATESLTMDTFFPISAEDTMREVCITAAAALWILACSKRNPHTWQWSSPPAQLLTEMRIHQFGSCPDATSSGS